ncbi:MAG: DUF3379 family protein [Abyssibacter sp.]|uniref:DUF3379 family protein n=1 Tax=Abyssibacter sp. TaxID=2320200 RepID=UPI00321AD839
MNCFDTRRALLTDPARLPEPIAEHVSQCSRCAREAAQIRRLDRRVAEVAQVPVPEGLTDRLKMAGPQPAGRQLLPWAGGLAVAASALLAWLVVGWSPSSTVSASEWMNSMVAHTVYDAAHELAPDPAAAQDFQRVLHRLGGRIAELPDGITRAGYCVLEGRGALHAVIERAGQRLVVYVIPGVATQSMLVRMQGWEGELLSAQGATVAVLGQQSDPAIEALVQSLADAVQWS